MTTHVRSYIQTDGGHTYVLSATVTQRKEEIERHEGIFVINLCEYNLHLLP